MLTEARVRPTAVPAGGAGRGVVQAVVGRALSFVFAYLATVIIARRLGPAEYGLYGVVISVLIWIQQTGRFTIPPAAAKLIPEDHIRSTAVEQAALSLGAVLFVSLFVGLWVAAGPLARLFGLAEGGALLFQVAALELPLFGICAVYRGVLQGRHDFLALSVADALYAAAKLAAVILLLGVWLSVTSALVANVVASLCTLLFVMTRLSIRIHWPAAAAVRPLVLLALPLGLYMVGLQTITQVDLWALKVLDRSEQSATIGLYVAAKNVAVVPGVILMVVSDVMLPSISRAVANVDLGRSKAYVQSAVRFLGILITPLTLVLMLSADELMTLLYSGEYQSGGTYVRVLVLYAVSLPFIDLFAQALSARGEPYRGGQVLLVVIPLAIVLEIVLIRIYGTVGAAYGGALAGIGAAVVLGALVARRFGALANPRTFVNIVVATAVMALIAGYFSTTDSLPVVVSAAALAGYGLVLVLLREIRSDDLAPLAFWKWGFR